MKSAHESSYGINPYLVAHFDPKDSKVIRVWYELEVLI